MGALPHCRRVQSQQYLRPIWVLVLMALGLAGLSACSTVGEALSPTDSTQGYDKQINESGETVYRRSVVATPSPSPWTGDNNDHSPTGGNPPLSLVNSADSPTSRQTGGSDSSSSSLDRTWYLPIEGAWTAGYAHLGVGIAKELLPMADLKAGISFFKGSDLYAGFDLAGRIKIPTDFVRPFVGIGGYLGDVKRCSTDYGIETCEKKFLSALYTEAGLEAFHIEIFYRNYNIEDAGKEVPTQKFWGVGLLLGF